MNADLIALYYLGALCAITLIALPLILLVRIARDVKKIREHWDRNHT